MENLTPENRIIDAESEVQSSSRVNSKQKKKRFPAFQYFLFWIFFFGLLFVSYQYGQYRGQQTGEKKGEDPISFAETLLDRTYKKDDSVDFSLFWRVWDTLEEKYVDSDTLDTQKMIYGAIDGMLRASGDPYTTFFDPEENKEFDEDISGEFEGIGAELEMRDDLVTIVAPLKGSPAEASGLRAEDVVIKVDDVDIVDETLNEAVKRIRGPKGTEVVLTVLRKSSIDPIDIKIVRDTIIVQSVEFEQKGDIALVEIRRFGDDTLSEFRKTLVQIRQANLSGMILDLRNNPGGYLETAIDMGGLLLEPGSVVVIEENSDGERKEGVAKKTALTEYFSSFPIAVLINPGSASASEILAGALQYHRDDVTLIGETTFGKGSVQELIPLPQSTSAKITVAKWLTPGGEHIDGKGIDPDIVVEFTEEDYEEDRDPQLEKALEDLGTVE